MLSPKRLCVVPVCKGEHFDLVHKFPMDNDRARSWLKILKIEDLLCSMNLEEIRKKRFVCTRHFQNSAYKNVESRSLNKTAMPSINIDVLDDPEGLDRLVPSKPVLNVTAEPEILNTAIREGFARKANRHVNSEPEILNTIVYEGISEVIKLDQNTSNYNVSTIQITQPTILQKVSIPKKIIKRPIQSVSGVQISTDELVPIAPPAKIFKHKNAQLMPAPQIVPKIIIAKNSISTQTENEPKIVFDVQQQSTEEEAIEELPPPPEPSKSKFIAIFECTPENVAKLQKKLESTNGIFDFENDFLKDENTDDKPADETNEMDKHDECLTIKNHETDQQLDINYFWLRDHCRCQKCYNVDTNQRKLSILDIPEDVKPNSWKLEDNNLTVNWNDDHNSVYAIDFILHSQLDITKKVLADERICKTYWSKEIIENTDQIARVSLNNLLCDDEMIRVIAQSLFNFGIAFIEKVPPNQQSTEIAIKRIFPIHKTFFGEMWTFSETSMEHSDTAYTKDFIGLHNDTTYFNDACGLQILHCVQANGEGGETLVVDGFKAAEDLKERENESFDRLCEYQIPSEYIEEGKHHMYCAPIIKKHPISGELEQVRFNMYDRAVLNTLPPSKIPTFYSDYRKLAKEINSEDNIWQFKLTPGTVLILDNWRLLHGRKAYTGKRVMTGCYVSRTEYLSLARTLKIIS